MTALVLAALQVATRAEHVHSDVSPEDINVVLSKDNIDLDFIQRLLGDSVWSECLNIFVENLQPSNFSSLCENGNL